MKLRGMTLASAMLLAACDGPTEGEIEPEFTRVIEQKNAVFNTLAGLTLDSTVEQVVEKFGSEAFSYGKPSGCNDELTPGNCYIFFKRSPHTFGGHPYDLAAKFEDYSLVEINLTMKPAADRWVCVENYEIMLEGMTKRYGKFYTPLGKEYEGELRKTDAGVLYKYDLNESGLFFIPQQRTFRGLPAPDVLKKDPAEWGGGNYVQIMAYELDKTAPCEISVSLFKGAA